MNNLTKKEKTIQTIMDAAINLFASQGYNATSTSHIAKEANVSEAIIFKYFKSKENLLKEIGSAAVSRIIENISIVPFLKNVEKSKDYPLKDFIGSIIHERLTFLDKNYEVIKLLLVEMQYSKNLRKQAEDIVFPKVFEVVEFIKTIIAEKANITSVRAGAIIRILTGVICSFVFQKYVLNINLSHKEIEIEIDEILSIIQKGAV